MHCGPHGLRIANSSIAMLHYHAARSVQPLLELICAWTPSVVLPILSCMLLLLPASGMATKDSGGAGHIAGHLDGAAVPLGRRQPLVVQGEALRRAGQPCLDVQPKARAAQQRHFVSASGRLTHCKPHSLRTFLTFQILLCVTSGGHFDELYPGNTDVRPLVCVLHHHHDHGGRRHPLHHVLL